MRAEVGAAKDWELEAEIWALKLGERLRGKILQY